ncbi:hypothetical protein [Streptomyces niveus]|uniref:hypothetical protein n=1 Tax=Streptomyces niveus TaxID=193462 RepID=UPI00114CEC7D|nr:hypothetical protein [Streptomyces niveus]
MSVNDLSPEDRTALVAERQEEYKNFWPGRSGRRARYTIEMFPLLHVDKRRGHPLIPATHDMKLRKVVETFGKCFKQELGFDSVPFVARHSRLHPSDPKIEVVLFDAQRVEATFPIAAGAAGLSILDGQRWLDWVWILPFERGKGLAERAWRDLEQTYGPDFKIQPPLSPAMEAFLSHNDIAPERWRF